jgi:hypothetical protein
MPIMHFKDPHAGRMLATGLLIFIMRTIYNDPNSAAAFRAAANHGHYLQR